MIGKSVLLSVGLVSVGVCAWAQCPSYMTTYGKFIRGDANNDGLVNVSDVVFIGNMCATPPGPSPPCNGDAADADGDGLAAPSTTPTECNGATGSDNKYLLDHLFSGGAAPPAPYPSEGCDCTTDLLANCSSPATTAALPITGTFVTLDTATSYIHFNDEFSTIDNTTKPDSVNLKTEITGECNSNDPDRTTKWQIRWDVADTQGTTKRASRDGTACQKLEAEIHWFHKFYTATCCCDPQCVSTWKNSLKVDPDANVVAFDFTDGVSVVTVPASGTGSPEDSEKCYQLCPSDYCCCTPGSHVPHETSCSSPGIFCGSGPAWFDEWSTPPQGQTKFTIRPGQLLPTSPDCTPWTLLRVRLGFNLATGGQRFVQYKWTRFANPDLAHNEGITGFDDDGDDPSNDPDIPEDKPSWKLASVKYLWCQ